MKSTHRLILAAVVAASTLAPASGAFAESWRGLADTYLAKARVWTGDGFTTAERNGYLSKSGKNALTGGNLTSGALSQSALAGGSGLSGLTSRMPKKLSSKIPKSVQ